MADTNLIVKTPEMLNALTNKFVDLEGLKVFWANAKAYVDTQDADTLAAAKAYTDQVAGKYAEGENAGTGLRGEFETAIKAEETARIAADGALQDQIDDLKGAVSGGTFFRGVFESTDVVPEPKNGDVVVVKVKDAEDNVIGDKEYIYNGTTSEWVELGDVTAEQQRISALETKVGTQRVGNDDESTGLYALIEEREEAVRQDLGVALEEAVGTYSSIDDGTDEVTPGTGLRGEIEERDAATLASANAYTDAAIEAVKGEIGIDGYYTKGEVDNLLTANSTADQAYADGVAATAEANANTYTDEAIAAIEFVFATHEDIDGIFGVTHE